MALLRARDRERFRAVHGASPAWRADADAILAILAASAAAGSAASLPAGSLIFLATTISA